MAKAKTAAEQTLLDGVAPAPGKRRSKYKYYEKWSGPRGPRQRSRRFCGFDEKLEFWTIPEPNSGCLLWLGSVTVHGYVRVGWLGRSARLNRLLWQEKRGPIPEGLHVLHKCDVRSCVNMDHYFLGTNQDNVDDKVRKGRMRSPFGEGHGNAKLNDDLVRMIRSSTDTSANLARKIGVSPALVGYVRRGEIWRHVK